MLLPSFQFHWRDEELNRTFDFILNIIKAVRFLRADYNLTKTKADCEFFTEGFSRVNERL